MDNLNIEEKQIIFNNNSIIEYTSDQEKVLYKIYNFINENKLKDENNYFLLSGYAGTGKTTIINNILSIITNINDNSDIKYPKNILLISPTNKASKVIMEKIDSEYLSKLEIRTLHSALYGAPNEEGKWLNPINLYNYYIIVDESSMIEKSVLGDLLISIRKSIIIFIGDNYQLEPVGEDPLLFDWDKSNAIFSTDNKYLMTEVKRQSLNSTILSLATLIRNRKDIYITKEICDDYIYYDNVRNFENNFMQDIKNHENSITIVNSNEIRNSYTAYIRKKLFEPNNNIPIFEGEPLISLTNTFYFKNGEIFYVDKVNYYEEFKPFRISYGKEKIEILFSKCKVLTTHGLEIDLLLIITNKPSLPENIIVSNYHLYSDFHNFMRDYIDKNKNPCFLRPNVCVCTYAYTVTCHKAQGSQFDNVYVYIQDLFRLSPRWFYTAITRAKKKLHVCSLVSLKTVSKKQLNNLT